MKLQYTGQELECKIKNKNPSISSFEQGTKWQVDEMSKELLSINDLGATQY